MLGTLLLPLNALLVLNMESMQGRSHPTYITIFSNVVFALLALIGINALCRRLFRRSLGRGDLLVVYMMLNIGSALAGYDMVFVGVSHSMVHQMTIGQETKVIWLRLLPQWMLISDPVAERAWQYGNASGWEWALWKHWTRPSVGYLGMLVPLLIMMMCIAALLRKQWDEREKLSFPLTWLPVEMTREGGGFFRNRAMWFGFAISAGILLNNCLARITLANPQIQLDFAFLGDVGRRTWVPLTIYPFVIGIGFLLPVDLLFSCTFFFWFWKLVQYVYDPIGDVAAPSYWLAGGPYIMQQTLGATYFIFAWSVWHARHHLKRALQVAWRGRRDEDAFEPMRYRWAFIGTVAAMAWWMVFWRWMGMRWWVSGVSLLAFVATMTTITRIRAELGPPVHEYSQGGTDQLLPRILGVSVIGLQSTAVLNTFYRTFNRSLRPMPMAFQMESYQIAKSAGAPMRQTVWPLIIAAVVGTAAAVWASAFLIVRSPAGGGNGWAGESAALFEQLVQQWQSGKPDSAIALGVGAAAAAVLSYCRVTWPGFPLSPIGFIISTSWTYHVFWLSLTVAWIIKAVVLRYLGLAGMRRVMPFFLGVILGEFTLRIVIAILELALNTTLSPPRNP